MAFQCACASENATLHLTKVFFEDSCLINQDPPPGPAAAPADISGEEFGALGAIATILVPKLVDLGTSLIAETLEQRSEDYSTSFSGQTSKLFEVNDAGVVGCLIVTRGSPLGAAASQSGALSELSGQLGFAGAPSFYFEAWAHYLDSSRTALAMTPAHFGFLGAAAKRTSKDNSKDIVLTIALSDVDDPNSSQQFLFALQNVPVGTVLNGEQLKGMRSLAQRLVLNSAMAGEPPLPGAANPVINTIGPTKPVNVSVTVAETEDAGDIFLRFSTLVKESKTELDPKISEVLLEMIGKE